MFSDEKKEIIHKKSELEEVANFFKSLNYVNRYWEKFDYDEFRKINSNNIHIHYSNTFGNNYSLIQIPNGGARTIPNITREKNGFKVKRKYSFEEWQNFDLDLMVSPKKRTTQIIQLEKWKESVVLSNEIRILINQFLIEEKRLVQLMGRRMSEIASQYDSNDFVKGKKITFDINKINPRGKDVVPIISVRENVLNVIRTEIETSKN